MSNEHNINDFVETPENKDSEQNTWDNTIKPGKKPHKNGKSGKVGAVLRNKKFKHGSMSTVMIIAVIIVAIALNIGAGALVDKFPSLNIDLTSDKRLSLSEKSQEVAQNVQNDTTITFLMSEETLQNYYGDQAVRFSQLTAKMAEINGKIKVQYVDLEKNPSFISKYTESTELTATSVIVESPKRHKILDIEGDLMKYNSNDQSWYNNADAAFASALLMVNSERLPVITFTTGTGEEDAANLKNYLQSNNFDCNELNLLTAAEIPAETDVLVLNAPAHDLTKEQVEILDKFLSVSDAAAHHLFVTFSPSQAANMPNLKAFMEDWGIGVRAKGSYILESDANRYVRYPQYPLLQINEEGLLEDIASANKPMVANSIVALEKLFDSQSGVSVQVVVSSYETAFGVPADVEDDWQPGDSDYGSFPVITFSSSGSYVNGAFQGASVTACASTALISSYLNQANLSNAESVLSLFRQLTGTTDSSEDIYISPVGVSQNNLTLSASQITTYGMIIFTVIVPLAVLVAGFVMWLRRRHL